ncbi:MAG: elongation factor Ts [Bacteroidaceae bacterium]|nr:elongation factor Ts [Bacteroidaceae bacterium]
MAITMEDIKKLRAMTGAGLADVKKALTEADGDFEKAQEIIRQKGQAIAAKRSDRETSNGCVCVKSENGFSAIIALKCETDFVANGADFVALANDIIAAAVANKCQTLDEVKALPLGEGTVQDAVVARSGITGEKMELDGYVFIEGENVEVYNHMNKNTLCTMVQTNKPAAEQAHAIALQVASMKPVALDESSVPQDVKDAELKVAIEKTKLEQVDRAINVALTKFCKTEGVSLGKDNYYASNEEHINEAVAKKMITEEQAAKVRQIKEEVPATVQINENMVQNIAQGRMKKFYKDSCLLNQDYCMDGSMTVAEFLKAADKELTVVNFKRFSLVAD